MRRLTLDVYSATHQIITFDSRAASYLSDLLLIEGDLSLAQGPP